MSKIEVCKNSSEGEEIIFTKNNTGIYEYVDLIREIPSEIRKNTDIKIYVTGNAEISYITCDFDKKIEKIPFNSRFCFGSLIIFTKCTINLM